MGQDLILFSNCNVRSSGIQLKYFSKTIPNTGLVFLMLANNVMHNRNFISSEVPNICIAVIQLRFNTSTFATTVQLTNGVTIESVTKMLGYKNLRTTQHYAKILAKKVSEDMKILRKFFCC